MLRFLKKRFKPSKNPVPPENPTHEITDIGAECGKNSEGEKDLRADEADGTDSTMAPDIDHGGGSRIANQDGRVEDQLFSAQNTSTLTPGEEGDNTSGLRSTVAIGTHFNIYSPSR